ncbi:Maf family protein [Hyphomicrobium sp.]|uniref:Maf family protein n=1 Tax=Hyphomicrobium sp. TaxID=82 RepID=UPI003F712196
MATDASGDRHANVVLASGSATRRAMLEAAGLDFTVDPADVDEAEIRDDVIAAGGSHSQVAERLAGAKAAVVSARHAGAFVIGGDQVLSFEGRLLEKAASMPEAREILRSLSGKTHTLYSCASLARDGEALWRHVEAAHLTMRAFSDAALDAYLAKVGDVVLTSVGAYQIEGPAIQLFETVDGAHATILGLPLLPLLGELHRRKVLVS